MALRVFRLLRTFRKKKTENGLVIVRETREGGKSSPSDNSKLLPFDNSKHLLLSDGTDSSKNEGFDPDPDLYDFDYSPS
jgi:hypothetical protein